jgi:hypothetical protein
VFSNESDGQDAAAFAPDASVGIAALRLRSERDGNGDGRVYLIAVTAADPSGNTAASCSAVVVPHDQSSSSIQAIRSEAATATAFCAGHGGTAPPGYLAIGSATAAPR